MARTVVGYISANGLNNMASASPTASVEALTGLPIATGLEVGQCQEFTAAEAKRYSYTTPTTAFPWGQLYDGTYMWVQLDPTVATDPIPLGTPVSWLQSAEDGATPTQVTTVSATNTDFAGVSIDSNFGKSHPYAVIQLNGKTNALFDSTGNNLTIIGSYVALATTGLFSATTAVNTAVTALGVGVGLVTTGVASVRNLIRITRAVSRF